MAKQSGLGDNFYIDGYDVSGDVNSLGRIGGGNSPLGVTGINKSANERIGGKREGSIEFTTYFNPSAAQEHAVLKTLPTVDRIVSYRRGTTLGNPAAGLVAKQLNYDFTRGDDGSLTMDVEAASNGFGIEWGRQQTSGIRTSGPLGALSSDTANSVDWAASSAFGAQIYIQVFSFTGTDATILIQESSDDGAGDPYANVTGGSQVITTAPAAFRIATASNQTIERYLRARVSTTAGLTSISWAVTVVRNETAVVF